MNAAIIDASVGIKWFLPEIHSAEARRWRSGSDELHVPAFFFDLEIANILWKKVQWAEITRVDADQRLYNSLAGSPWSSHICWVGDLPTGL